MDTSFISRIWNVTKSRLAPVALLCVAVALSVFVLGTSVHTVTVDDGESIFTVRTLTQNVESVLGNVGLKSQSYKITDTKTNKNKTNISLSYTFPVFVTMGDETSEIETTSATVGDILKNAGYNVDEHDMVQPSVDTLVTKTTYIDYSNVDYVSGSYTEAIPCKMETIYSDSLESGVTNTVKKGTDGLQEVTYTAKVVNGETVETVVQNVTTLSNAVNGQKIVGTKKPAVTTSANVKCVSTLTPAAPIELDANGIPVNYKKHMTVQATAYTYTGNNCSTGVAPQPGYIAVNPRVIPYGTKMYIRTADGTVIYGYAVAADTGGFIKSRPNNVDLFMASKSACVAFGRRNVEIYILE